MKSDSFLSRDLHLHAGFLERDSFGENAPGNFLRDCRFRNFFSYRRSNQFPSFAVAKQIPTSAAYPGNIELRERSGCGGNISIRARQGAKKAVQNGKIKLTRHN